ncbi:hypothetical protein KKC83_05405 [Patescibacteria group bacterium]|nr:hypothetical protein [Candidatus Falkowbacteria bacterium]MBU3906325.1 hypothetical protein [Patescibacteria group bacterium]MCG2697708.1 hypothetical protein [Candidatus Parcubacteria bacterium]MBU4015228.1 hypothetical protein [Patescibacteria group bacterium]MBU4026953.1 hypothetical protein [Patescibacteria group bacterium]
MKWKKIGSSFYEITEKKDAEISLQSAKNETFNPFFRGRHFSIVENLLEKGEISFEELEISPAEFKQLEYSVRLLIKNEDTPRRLDFREFCPC